MMALTFHGRLPGVICEVALPALRENPLRLDIAAFVGFAERGPLDMPIAVEDISQYRAVFGGDLLLARSGQPVFANVAEAVRTFFDNGGRRCYVVRVAGQDARPNRFRLPGLVTWDNEAFKTVIAPAAWVGRWSDNMSVGTQLLNLPLHIGNVPPTWDQGAVLHLEVATPTTVVPNDLLRLHFDGTGKPLILCSVDSVQRTGGAVITTRGIPINVKIKPDMLFAFTPNLGNPLPLPARIERKRGSTWEMLSDSPSPLQELPELEDGYSLSIEVPDSVNIKTNEVLRISCSNDDVLFFPIADVEKSSAKAGMNSFRVTSRAPRWQLTPVQVARLTETGWETLSPPLDHLEVQQGRNKQSTLYLPGTESVQVGDLLRVRCTYDRTLLFPISNVGLQHAQEDGSSPQAANHLVLSRAAMWELSEPAPASYGNLLQVDLLSFNLVIREGEETEEVWSELRFGAGPNYWIDTLVPQIIPDMSQSDSSQRHIPGLDQARSSRLGVPETEGAAAVLYLPLGMDKLLHVEAFARPLPDTQNPNPFCPLASKDGLERFEPIDLFLDPRLADVGMRDLLNEANQLLYLNPASVVKPLSKLHSLLFIDEIGLIALPDLVHRGWVCVGPVTTPNPHPPPPPPAPEPDWSHFQCCKAQPTAAPQQFTTARVEPVAVSLLPREPQLLDVRQQLNGLPVLEPPELYKVDDLLVVQQALINLCAARADVVGLLSLPQHFQRRDVLEWQRRLLLQRPDLQDGVALSYVAAYHPWLLVPEEVTPELAPQRAIPPDGCICGMIAARELERGPWIAPANVPLPGVVGLTPLLSTADSVDLFNAQINIVRQLPGQFTLMSAHTLSTDRLLLQIAVRRLLIYLRKLALQQGMRYVFESNNEIFCQRVQATFENILTVLTARGAMSAFEVVTSSEINTPNDFDNGRFLIALKVAPTQPIEFITIVLLRAGEDLLAAVER